MEDTMKYVFLTFAIPGIGGTQIYVRNKLRYLRDHGWTPVVITEEADGEIVVEDLIPFKDSIIPEMIQSPMLLKKSERDVVLDRMAAIIGEVNANTVIESNYIMASLWGELIAKKLGVRHIIFLIQEDYSLSDKRFMRFFDFKYNRGELAGNTPVALTKLFEHYRTISDPDKSYLVAYCSNAVEDCMSVHDNCIVEADYHIGSIGRLNKPFVIPMIRDIVGFVKNYPSKTFQLVLFGGTPSVSELETIIALVEAEPNLSIYITGPIFPVPQKLLEKMDVFISSAGAADTSAKMGLITIAIDANDFEPIGVLNHTTAETIHRIPGQAHESTEKLLNQILIEREYCHEEIKQNNSLAECEIAFKKHMDFVGKSSNVKTYYDIKRVGPNVVSKILYFLRHR